MRAHPNELALIDRWQRGFPLNERPFAEAGRAVGLDEESSVASFLRLQEAGIISRIGAVVKPHSVGASTLAAMRVPDARIEEVAAIVSREPAVNHNYLRTHSYNLWFVVAGPDRATVDATLRRIEGASGLAALDLPLVRAFHVDLGFPLRGPSLKACMAPAAAIDCQADSFDCDLLAAIEGGLPILPRPYDEVARRLGVAGNDVRSRLQRLADARIISRFGCIVNHRMLGYTANAMTVWDIADAFADDVGRRFAGHPAVTLCYRRPRRLPDWPYNLFCMIHARSRAEALAEIAALGRLAGTAPDGQAVLFSTRCFKQRGATFARRVGGVH